MTAVITGMGVLAPTGLGAREHWNATVNGRRGITVIDDFDPTGFPVRVAGRLPGFAASDHLPSRLLVQTDRWTQIGMAATGMAIDDAGVRLAEMDPYECAVVTASASGGNLFVQREIQNLWTKGAQSVTAYQSIAWFYAATTGQVSIRHGMKGTCGVVVADQAGGLDALADARKALHGGMRLVACGGSEAPIGPYALACQSPNGFLDDSWDPALAYRPFDRSASGYVPGEGGAMFIVETLDEARKRGAVPYGEIAGHAATMDPAPGSRRGPALKRAIERALVDAGLRPDEVDVVFADGAGVVERDRVEAEAIAGMFGVRAVPVTCPKTMTGRLYSGGAALDVATALLAMRASTIPPTVGVTDLACTDIDLVLDRPRAANLRTALVIARGAQGFNSALVLRAVPND